MAEQGRKEKGSTGATEQRQNRMHDTDILIQGHSSLSGPNKARPVDPEQGRADQGKHITDSIGVSLRHRTSLGRSQNLADS